MSTVTAVLALHRRARGSFGPSTSYPSPQTPGMHAYSPMLTSEASPGGTPPSFSPQPAFRQTAFQQVRGTPDSSRLLLYWNCAGFIDTFLETQNKAPVGSGVDVDHYR